MLFLARSCSLFLILASVLCFAGQVWSEDDTPPERAVTGFDKLTLVDGSTVMGTVIDVTGEGDVSFQAADGSRSIYPHKELAKPAEYRITAAKAARNRGKWAMKHDDPDDLIATIIWAMTVKDTPGSGKTAKEEALDLAHEAMKRWPNNLDIAGKALLPLLLQKGDTKEVEEIARRLVKKDPGWTEGYEFVAKILEADPARHEELEAWLTIWLANKPTALKPNHDLAHLYEKAGRLHDAEDAYRKCFELHNDFESGLGYARVALERGDAQRALTAATKLSTNEKVADEAKALVGAAKLALGDVAGAGTALEEASKGTLSDATALEVHYNLGLVYLRTGQADQARQQWSPIIANASADPAIVALTKFGMAALDRQALAATDIEHLPNPDTKSLAQLLNASVDLEHGRAAVATGLDAGQGPRQQFLATLGKLVQGGPGADQVVHDLKQVAGTEALRWQIYGLLLDRKYEAAQAAIASLPEDDAYALAYQVCIADALHHGDEAKAWYLKAQKAANPPREWLGMVAIFYEQSHDTDIDEKFAWQAGDVLNTPWEASAPGTGIHIHAQDNQLVLDGTQSASQDPVSRAYRMAQVELLHQVQLDLDISAMADATAGLEILDPTHQNGLELGVRGDQSLAKRTLTGGIWGQWQPLSLQVQGTHISLCLDYNFGKVMAFLPDDATKKYALGEIPKTVTEVSLGVFATSEPGKTWKVAATRFRIQMRPRSNPNAPRQRFGDN